MARATLDLDQSAYRMANAIAKQRGMSMGEVVAEAVAAYYGQSAPESIYVGRSSDGFRILTLGRPITAEDIADLENE